MTSMPGLRERKKAKTRWAIQEHALRLFAAQGYEATTVDQIAAAAEISPSTFFRYFPTKEDVVVQDEYDDLFLEAFRQAGPALDPVAVLRAAIAKVAGTLDQQEWDKSMARSRLVLSVPALRARSMENFMVMAQRAAAVLAEGAQLPPDDPTVLAITGACLGVFCSVALSWSVSDSIATLTARLDATFRVLEGIDWHDPGPRRRDATPD
jgi:AcrR family transcriptional regulator